MDPDKTVLDLPDPEIRSLAYSERERSKADISLGIEMTRGKRGSSVAARRSSPRLDANAEVTLSSTIPQSSRCPRTRVGGNVGAGRQNIESPNVTNEGGSDPTAAQEWLKKMEKYFRALGCSEEQKVIYATFMLEGDVKIWWETKEGDMTVEEYEAKFNESSRYAPELVVEEFDKIEMFENRLRPEIHKNVTVIMSKTFEEAVE
ncbi:uncharacterized protein LOC109834906 [Asparagus officinalis]|uniref:uncharacterized protein LOC109834906 n=1 Tax=Asparagus officinalis TaxID=4686 RepID=UPI00098E5C43|nr:uncharacterized protein LOC109834906 [Asparagus officinalis]